MAAAVKPRTTVFVTNDGSDRWLAVQHPDGLVPPPIIELHEPLVGPVAFYFASCYHLPVPKGAPRED